MLYSKIFLPGGCVNNFPGSALHFPSRLSHPLLAIRYLVLLTAKPTSAIGPARPSRRSRIDLARLAGLRACLSLASSMVIMSSPLAIIRILAPSRPMLVPESRIASVKSTVSEVVVLSLMVIVAGTL